MVNFFSTSSSISDFVPKCSPIKKSLVIALNQFVNQAKALLVLTGAGLSTESGIPDYRSEKVGLYARSNRRPVEYKQFVENENARRRYWARNFVAWPQFSAFQPNTGHNVLAGWEKINRLHHIITQNVDRLHSKAGSAKVLELHGNTHKIICLGCGAKQSRFTLQDEINLMNNNWLKTVDTERAMAPDGDILLSDEAVANFQVPSCNHCGGILKPDVVFFGENVPMKTVVKVDELVKECDSMLVIGSSLFVYSSYRIALKCKEEGKKFAILNIGPTRADHLADLKIVAKCGDILPKVQLN